MTEWQKDGMMERGNTKSPGHIYGGGGGGIKTNLVEVTEILFPVKFDWTQIDSE